ncbi:hypothetical protein D3C74_23300 [compost metagenome]
MNNYLFDFCFSPQYFDKAHEYFVYYLYLSYEAVYGIKTISSVEGLTGVVDKDWIIKYWTRFKDETDCQAKCDSSSEKDS